MATNDANFSAGTETTVITGGATRATDAFSTSGEVTALSSNLYPFCKAVLSCSYSSAPTEGDTVDLYRRDINIDSTNDATIPEAGFEYHYMGSFAVKDSTSQQYVSLNSVPLAYGDQEFYIKNSADQTMDSDYTVKITPLTYVPAA